MSSVFADASFFIATIDPRAQHHESSRRAFTRLDAPILYTSADVASEVLAHFAKWQRGMRLRAHRLLNSLILDPDVRFHYSDENTFHRALAFYASRPDKDYSLVDCRSMLLMQDFGIQHVLSSDIHFEQEGFFKLF
ncbi:MAG: type II toxin-antitoxin system VapC family toxin [Planctomycetes bacterium]|nr:type II toxin-antitoxin system VapC family toxin [Planctomycetota bacterium]